MITWLLLALGATLGAALRYYTTIGVVGWLGVSFPYATMIVNVAGCFVLGLVLTAAEQHPWITNEYRLLIGTAFCGSLTTFSTFSYETWSLLSKGQYLAGMLNVVGNLVPGLLAVMLGILLARMW
ncbi:MAG: fluoride efflux transporter CrcB [Chloroflexaceae bacterium]|nr:fluoride efflux transporter CrcB [Chloroflexaceae bacterium]